MFFFIFLWCVLSKGQCEDSEPDKSVCSLICNCDTFFGQSLWASDGQSLVMSPLPAFPPLGRNNSSTAADYKLLKAWRACEGVVS